MENVQKPKDNLQISWFGGYLEGIWRAFFHDFSMWDVWWWILGCTLTALGRYSAPGSGSGRPLGGEREPPWRFLVPLPTPGSSGEWGLEAQGKGREGVFGCWGSPQPTSWPSTMGSGLWEVEEMWADKPQPTAHFLPCRIHKSMGSGILEVGCEVGGVS